jgi:hypothetical protein
MPFTQVGFGTKLTWAMFGTPLAGDPPGPDDSASAASTATSQSFVLGAAVPVKGSSPARFTPSTTVTITTGFNRSKSWVMGWAKKRPAPLPADLLHHEQLHYEISALVGRDALAAAALFVADKPTFNTASEATEALKAAIQAVFDQGQAMQDAYDAAVHPEQEQGITRGPEQLRWDGFVKSAKEDPRDSGEKWPDGRVMKKTIFSVTP